MTEAEQERAAIVAYLREMAQDCSDEGGGWLVLAAAYIENGEHLRANEEGDS